MPPPWSSLDTADATAREGIDAARRSLAAGNPRDALQSAGWAWRHHRYLREAYDIATEAAREIGDRGLERALASLVSEPQRPGFWLEAGWALVDQGHSELAITLLEEAFRLDPESLEVRESLVIAYSDEGRHGDVVRLAQEVDLNTRPALAFPLAWSALMIRRPELIDRAIWSLGELARRAKEVRGVYAKAAAAVERYRAFPPEDDIRHWHFVQYGGLTIDLNPDLEQAGGRYSLLCPDQEQIAGMLVGLLRVLDAVGVKAGPWGYLSRDGEILARTLASLSKAPAVQGVPTQGWLVVADPREAGPHRERVATGPGQHSFAFSFPWTIWGPRVVDVTGLWAEILVLPWNGGWEFRGGNVHQRPRDERDARAIAAELGEVAGSLPSGRWAELVRFASERQGALLLKNTKVPRGLPYVPDAPLPDSSFKGVLT
jgi:tetratricopeptide (TPR) repeat protein